FLDGHPGRYVVMARFGGGHWYVAGINADNVPRDVVLDLRELGPLAVGRLITDGDFDADGDGEKDRPAARGDDQLSFNQLDFDLPPGGKLAFTLPPRGGFVAVLD
ncbi:MAG TPA: glycoside hydrolase family 97 C-terminal domain-containing protein, partial [Candidatus Thermoplasmatota archaeon]